MTDFPHYRFPFQATASGDFAIVEQDSDDEIAASIATICSYPIGSRPERPEFGIPEGIFEQGGPDLGALRSMLEGQEPRASIRAGLSDELLTNAIALVQVGYIPTDSSQAPGPAVTS